MPPDRDLEFIIELALSTTPIAKRPYRIHTNELEELRKLYDNLCKCEFCLKEVAFLGHVMSAGVVVDPSKVEAVLN